MEVHHHPHLPHGKKKFKDYFLEFLMIFLAVTMGFLAESLREHMSDKEKETGYIESLVKNLKEDTVNISAAITENKTKLQKLIALEGYTAKDFADTAKRIEIYKLQSFAIGFYSEFKSSDATMQQLKNSGGLQYIQKDHVADSIVNYDNEIKIIYAAENLYVSASDVAILATDDIFDKTVYYDTAYVKNGGFTGKAPPLLSTDPIKIKQVMNRVDYEIGATRNYIYNLELRLPVAERLIAYLQKEYGLGE